MHPALLIEEILALIVVHFRTHGRTTKATLCARRTLKAIACCCKAFSGVALAQLWRYQSSLVPLLKMFPSCQLNEQNSFVLASPITPYHWERSQRYAALIHVLDIYRRERIHPSVYRALTWAARGQPLLPSLNRFTCRNATRSGEELLLFISSRLHRVDIRITNSRTFLGDPDSDDPPVPSGLDWFVKELANKATYTQSITLAGSLLGHTMTLIPQFRELQYLDLNSAGPWQNYSALLQLSELQRLQYLDINLAGIVLYNQQRPLRSSFPSLEVIRLSGLPNTIEVVLEMISSPRLRSCSITSLFSYSWEEWCTCLDPIGSHKHLEEFRIRLLSDSLSGPAEGAELMDIAGPLLSLSQLQGVWLNFEGPLRVMPQTVASMAVAWPQLRVFRLWCIRKHEAPTLETLVYLANHCPRLHTLETILDGQKSPSMSVLGTYVSPLTSLSQLRLLGDVTLDDDSEVVASTLLKALFPSLTQFEVSSWSSQSNIAWNRIKRSLPLLQTTEPKYSAR